MRYSCFRDTSGVREVEKATEGRLRELRKMMIYRTDIGNIGSGLKGATGFRLEPSFWWIVSVFMHGMLSVSKAPCNASFKYRSKNRCCNTPLAGIAFGKLLMDNTMLGTSPMRFAALIFVMGFFSTLLGCKPGGDGPFQSESACAENRSRQLTMSPQTVAQLRTYGITDESQLKLEYFFYTNTKEKAAALAEKLAGMGYTGSYDRSAGDKRLFVVTGWTAPMRMDEKTVLDWTGRMCDFGREHDCEFDGWGTNPTQ